MSENGIKNLHKVKLALAEKWARKSSKSKSSGGEKNALGRSERYRRQAEAIRKKLI